jgi:hypothetical protein
VRHRGQRLVLLLVFPAASGCAPIAAAVQPPDATPVAHGRLHVLDPYLHDRIRALETRSLRFRAAVDAVRNGERTVFVGTPLLLSALPLHPALVGHLPRGRLGEFRAIAQPETGRVDTLVVSIDLERIIRMSNWPLPGARARAERITDAVLVHEIWGHLVPVAASGNIADRCRDPVPGEPELDSCVMRRENELRAELGWRVRREYRWRW